MRIPLEEVQRREKLVEGWYAESPFLTYAEINERLKGMGDLTMAPTTLSKIKNRMMTRIARGTVPKHLRAASVAPTVVSSEPAVEDSAEQEQDDAIENKPAEIQQAYDAVKRSGEHFSMVTIAMAESAKTISVAQSACKNLLELCAEDAWFGKQAKNHAEEIQSMLQGMAKLVSESARDATIALTLMNKADEDDIRDLNKAVELTKSLAEANAG